MESTITPTINIILMPTGIYAKVFNQPLNSVKFMQRHTIKNHLQLKNFSFLYRTKNSSNDDFSDNQNEVQDPDQNSPALVFSHASGFNAQTYRQLFKQIDPSIDIYAIDQRGHGLTSAHANADELKSWRTYEEDLSEFVDWLDRPVILAGHSMGGAVSTKVAAMKPDRVKALVLVEPVIMPAMVDTVMGILKKLNLGQLIPLVNSAKNRRASFSSIDEAVENYTNKGAFKSWSRTWIEDYVIGGTVNNSQGGISLSCKPEWEAKTFAVSGNNPWTAIKNLKCPITIIKGKTGSSLHPLAVSRIQKLHPYLDYTLIDNASHFLPMEYPEQVAKKIHHTIAKIRN